MDSATMVATTDWDTMDTAWDSTDTGTGRRGLLTPRLTPTTTLTDWVTTDWDTAWDTTEVTATTCTERGLLTLRLTPTFSMATTAMATAILTMVDTTGVKLFLECQIR